MSQVAEIPSVVRLLADELPLLSQLPAVITEVPASLPGEQSTPRPTTDMNAHVNANVAIPVDPIGATAEDVSAPANVASTRSTHAIPTPDPVTTPEPAITPEPTDAVLVSTQVQVPLPVISTTTASGVPSKAKVSPKSRQKSGAVTTTSQVSCHVRWR